MKKKSPEHGRIYLIFIPEEALHVDDDLCRALGGSRVVFVQELLHEGVLSLFQSFHDGLLYCFIGELCWGIVDDVHHAGSNFLIEPKDEVMVLCCGGGYLPEGEMALNLFEPCLWICCPEGWHLDRCS